MITATSQKDYINQLKNKLATEPEWAQHALNVVYGNQNADERFEANVKRHNNVGFTQADCRFLTSLAKQLLYKGSLSDKQNDVLLKKMPKYAGQVFDYCILKGTVIKNKDGLYISSK